MDIWFISTSISAYHQNLEYKSRISVSFSANSYSYSISKSFLPLYVCLAWKSASKQRMKKGFADNTIPSPIELQYWFWKIDLMVLEFVFISFFTVYIVWILLLRVLMENRKVMLYTFRKSRGYEKVWFFLCRLRNVTQHN